MTGAACGAGNAYPSGAPDCTSGFHKGSCCPVICVSIFHVILCDCVSLYFFYFVEIKDSVHKGKVRKSSKMFKRSYTLKSLQYNIAKHFDM